MVIPNARMGFMASSGNDNFLRPHRKALNEF
jgi:hypothetical protein